MCDFMWPIQISFCLPVFSVVFQSAHRPPWICWLRLAAVNRVWLYFYIFHHSSCTCMRGVQRVHSENCCSCLKACTHSAVSWVMSWAQLCVMHKPEMFSLACMLIACGALLHAALLTRPPMARRGCIRLHFNKACHYLLACDVPLHH